MQRIVGIDVARALAVIGMIVVNFKIVLGENGAGWIKTATAFLSSKAAATFVVLAGVGLALISQKVLHKNNQASLKQLRKTILKRASLLFAIGISYLWIWPADILHFYGVYMGITLLFINKRNALLIGGIIGLTLLFPALLLFFDYEQGWNFTTLDYSGFWTWEGFFRNLFFNGFHPVIPWAAFMLFGLWLGRQNLRSGTFLMRSFWVSLVVFLSIQGISYGMLQSSLFAERTMTEMEYLEILFGTTPMPPMPLYMLNGMSIATLTITTCIMLAKKFENVKIIEWLHNTGRLALTFYIAHIVFGIGLPYLISGSFVGSFDITFSVGYALLFSFFCVVFANIYLERHDHGPVETLFRKLVK